MIARNKHMVSKVNWDLSFNEKQTVQELQGKLSSWSKSEMLVEMEAIFNSICPTGETWQIESLSIDLGEISYENLHYELPKKFREALLNKLKDSIYRGYLDGKPIKIMENGYSSLMLLRSYLELGYMPWNYSGSLSINSLLLEQMTQHRDKLIEIIREIGQDITVRKRIAWQFNDRAIRKIIKELEPNHHEEIFDFTSNIRAIQEKENVVRSSSSDFKKNLWFWVLNYLFEERGTLFNRLSFMESSIRQMAKHYNIGFELLFQEIDNTVREIVKRTKIKGDFVQTLSLLSGKLTKEKRVVEARKRSEKSYLKEIKHLLLTPKARRRAKTKAYLNELVFQMSQRNAPGLKQVVMAIGSQSSLWKGVLADLNANARLAILRVLQPNNYTFVVESIHFFERIEHLRSAADRLNWESETISFLIGTAETAFSADKYLENQLIRTHFLPSKSPNHGSVNQVVKAFHKEASETRIQISTFETIRKKVGEHLIPSEPASIIKQVNQLLKDVFTLYRSKKGGIENILDKLQTVFEHLTSTNPNHVLSALREYLKEPDFEEVLIALVDRKLLHQLLNADKNNSTKRLIAVYQTLANTWPLNEYSTADERDNFVFKSFYSVLKSKSVSTNEFETVLVSNLLEMMLSWSVSEKQKLLTALVASPKVKKYKTLKNKILRSLDSIDSFRTKEDILTLVDSENIDISFASIVRNWLNNQLKNNPTTFVQKLSRAEEKKLVDFLVPAGNEVHDRFITQFRQKSRDIPELLKTNISLVFWKCVNDFKTHGGKATNLERMLERTLNKLIQSVVKRNTMVKRGGASRESNRLNEKIAQLNKHIVSGKERSEDVVFIQENIEKILLENPQAFRIYLAKIKPEKAWIERLAKHTDILFFASHIFRGTATEVNQAPVVLKLIMDLAEIEGDSGFKETLKKALWRDVFAVLKEPQKVAEVLKARLRDLFRQLALKKDLSANQIFEILTKFDQSLPNYIQSYFINMNPSFKKALVPDNTAEITEKERAINAAVNSNEMQPVFSAVLFQQKVPVWFGENQYFEADEVLTILLKQHEFEFYEMLKLETLTDPVIFRLRQTIKVKDLIAAIEMTHPNQTELIQGVHQLFRLFENHKFASISNTDVQNLLFKKVILAWKTNNWRLLSPKQLWQELIWEAQIKYGIKKGIMVRSLEGIKEHVPTRYQFALNAIIQQENEKKTSNTGVEPSPVIQLNKQVNTSVLTNQSQTIDEGISVSNAGVVLINSYISMLFDRLGLLENGVFKDAEHQEKAVNYLQFVVNGLTENEEHHLVLNKVICGLHPSVPVKSELDLSKEDKILIEGMISAIINYWPAIGECSPNGFRGNWLIRDGVLKEYEDKWTLFVEKRAYDILINKSPFSFSLIKQKWMEKPIHVEWAY